MPTTNDPNQLPDWTRSAHRVDRPKVDIYYKPEEGGAVDGVLVWQGQEENRTSGDTYHLFVIRDGQTGKMIGVAERASLRNLRQARPGSPVYVKAVGKKDIGDGRSMWEFEAYARDVDHTSPQASRTADKPVAAKADKPAGNSVPGPMPF